MPFKSEKQRRYLWANEPEIARKWAKNYKDGGYVPPGYHLMPDGSIMPDAVHTVKNYKDGGYVCK